MSRVGRALLIAPLAVVAVACGSSQSGKPTCDDDRNLCSAGMVCLKGTCVPQTTGRTVAIDISPSSASTAAQTELLNVTLTGEPLNLAAENRDTVMGYVAAPSTTLFAPEAHVLVTIPSLIPGRDALSFNPDMAAYQFSFSVAHERVGPDTPASFRFSPGATAQTQPPVPLQKALLSSIMLVFPAVADLIQVRGRLIDANAMPLGGQAFSAQISDANNRISNVITLDEMGWFKVLIPPTATAKPPSDLVTLAISSTDPAVPELLIGPVSLAALAAQSPSTGTPPTFVMPPHLPPQTTTIRVLAEDKPQASVTARFRVDMSAIGGIARYEVSATTDAAGEAKVALIPGVEGAPLTYRVLLEGPADAAFRYASQCVEALNVGLDDTDTIVTPAAFTMVPKQNLSGLVSDDIAMPVAGARVTATLTGNASACAPLATRAAASTTTDSSGYYLLLVDPGTYRLSVEPKELSASPRLDDATPVSVTHPTVHNMSLPAGEGVQGVAFAFDGATPLPGATITFFDVFCSSSPCESPKPPVQLAQTKADPNGNFTVVLPKAMPQ